MGKTIFWRFQEQLKFKKKGFRLKQVVDDGFNRKLENEIKNSHCKEFLFGHAVVKAATAADVAAVVHVLSSA